MLSVSYAECLLRSKCYKKAFFLRVVMLNVFIPSVFMLSVVIRYAECLYAKCCYPECLSASKTLCFFRFLFQEISTKPQQRVIIDVFVQSQRKKEIEVSF
jgi:hypothetical protein